MMTQTNNGILEHNGPVKPYGDIYLGKVSKIIPTLVLHVLSAEAKFIAPHTSC